MMTYNYSNTIDDDRIANGNQTVNATYFNNTCAYYACGYAFRLTIKQIEYVQRNKDYGRHKTKHLREMCKKFHDENLRAFYRR